MSAMFEGSCSIIQLQYSLEFRVHPAGVGFPLLVQLPVTVGTIPLREFMNQFRAAVEPGYPGNYNQGTQTNSRIVKVG